jgi:hypothetical protein
MRGLVGEPNGRVGALFHGESRTRAAHVRVATASDVEPMLLFSCGERVKGGCEAGPSGSGGCSAGVVPVAGVVGAKNNQRNRVDSAGLFSTPRTRTCEGNIGKIGNR